MDKKTTVPDHLADRLREASRKFGEQSTALTEADIDAAAVARRAYREAQFAEEAAQDQSSARDQVSSQQALGAAALLIEEEVRADVRSGIRSDLLLGVVPAAVLVGGLAAAWLVFDVVIPLRVVATIGLALLVITALAALTSTGNLGDPWANAFGRLGAQRLLGNSSGALMAGVLLFVAAGVALSQYTKSRQQEVRALAAFDFKLIDASVELALAAQRTGIESTKALELAERATGINWNIEPAGSGNNGYVMAKASLAKAEALVTYPKMQAYLEGGSLPQTRLLAANGKLLDSRTYLIGKVAEAPSLSNTHVTLTFGDGGTTKTYVMSRGLLAPPAGTTVLASLKDEKEVVNLQPVDWLAARVKSAEASTFAPAAAAAKAAR